VVMLKHQAMNCYFTSTSHCRFMSSPSFGGDCFAEHTRIRH
jgi:hypothetical protein